MEFVAHLKIVQSIDTSGQYVSEAFLVVKLISEASIALVFTNSFYILADSLQFQAGFLF